MGKAILLIRVSTDRQEYDAQTDELIKFVKSFGYTDEDIITIQDKESAIKLSEEERQGLNKLKEHINNNHCNIDAVYIWELSRLSRQPKVLYSIRDYLIERKINLIVKEPYLKLLTEDKEINPVALNQLGFFINLVENEMLDKKARFKRGKTSKALQGKYTGGYIRYGYTIDADKKYQINDNEANVIRLIYNLYETGKYSHRTICDELKALGYNNDVANIGKVQNVLKSIEYTGSKPANKNLNIAYPAIITIEQFNACKQQRTINNVKLNKSTTDIYYSHLLLTCACCGKRLQPKISSHLYKCPDRTALTQYSANPTIQKCVQPQYLNMQIMDSLLWYIAKEKEAITILSSTQEQINQNNIKIDELNKKADSVHVRFDELKKRRNRLGLSFSDGMIDEDTYNKRKKDFITEEQNIEQDKIKYANEIDRLTIQNNNISANISKMGSLGLTGEFGKINQNLNHLINQSFSKSIIIIHLDSIKEHQTRYDIIRKQIANVTVSTIGNNTKSLTVEYINSDIPNETYIYRKDGKQVKPIILKGNKVIEIPIVKQYKAAPSNGQYDKIKAKGELNPEYAIRMQMYKRYHSSVYRVNKNEYLSIEEKQIRLDELKERYKLYITLTK